MQGRRTSSVVLRLPQLEVRSWPSLQRASALRPQDGPFLSLVCAGAITLKQLQLTGLLLRVGGIVGETSYKFFVQFLFYASAYCIFTLTCFAVYLARAGTNGFWISGIGLAGFFGLFACGMTLSSLQMAFQNLTTIENLGRNTKVWVLAALIPKINRFTSTTNTAMDVQSPKPSMPSYAFPFPTITFEVGKGTSPPPVYHQPNTSFTIQPATRTFAILSLEAGRNPFDLGPWGNIQQIMGYTFLEWLLPIRYSPCADHSSPESAYAMSPEIRKMRLSLGPD